MLNTKKYLNDPLQIIVQQEPGKDTPPVKPDKNPNPKKPKPGPGGKEPEKNDPTRIEEPNRNDPTRIDEPPSSEHPIPEKQNIFLKNSADNTINALHELVLIQNHRLEGYRMATNLRNRNADIKNILPEGAELSGSCLKYLIKSVMLFGKEPVVDTAFSGEFSNAWLNAQYALSYSSYRMIMRAFEIGERETQRAYADVLKINSIPVYIRETLLLQKEKLREHYYCIKSLGHEEIKKIRNK